VKRAEDWQAGRYGKAFFKDVVAGGGLKFGNGSGFCCCRRRIEIWAWEWLFVVPGD
jgi:hypothetical protein